MRILFCGDRNWEDIGMVYLAMKDLPVDTVIVTGGAKGADSIAYDVAERLSLTAEVFKANWTTYGLAAGPIRNTRMLESGIDKVFAFHDNLSKSKGTKDCVNQAIKRGIEVEVIGHGKWDHFHGKEKTSKKEV